MSDTTNGMNANASYGHTCPQCGAWIIYGTAHACNGIWQGQFGGFGQYTTTREAEIIALLTEIRDLLKSKSDQQSQAQNTSAQ